MLTKPYHLLSFQTILPAGPPQVSVPYHHHSSLATMMLATGVFTPVLWLNWSERAAHYVKSCIIYPRHCSFFHDVSETFSSWYLCLKHNGSQSIHLPRRLLSLSVCAWCASPDSQPAHSPALHSGGVWMYFGMVGSPVCQQRIRWFSVREMCGVCLQ